MGVSMDEFSEKLIKAQAGRKRMDNRTEKLGTNSGEMNANGNG
jgi:hypothetical protein